MILYNVNLLSEPRIQYFKAFDDTLSQGEYKIKEISGVNFQFCMCCYLVKGLARQNSIISVTKVIQKKHLRSLRGKKMESHATEKIMLEALHF